MISREKLTPVLYLFLSGLVLCFYAFYNKYPMIYPDSGAYIYSGYLNIVLIDRPIPYGWFIRHIGLNTSFWFPIYCQGFIMAFLINQCFKKFSKHVLYSHVKTLITCVVLSAFSAVSVLVSQLMPDVFTSISLISLALLLFGEEYSKSNLVGLILIFLYASITHFSHLNINLLTLFTFTVVFIIIKKTLLPFAKFNYKKLLLVWTLALSSFLIIGTINALLDKSFYITKSSKIFFVAKMAESGILEKYLTENCNNNFALCNYKESIPPTAGAFLWDSNSPFYKIGGWEGSEVECDKIISATFSDPKFIKLHIIEAIKATLNQLFVFDVGNGIINFGPGTSPYDNIQKFLPIELNSFKVALQSYGQFDFKDLNNRTVIFLCFCVILLAVFPSSIYKNVSYKPSSKLTYFLIFVIIAMVMNAFICGTFANIYGRLQARVIWLFEFAVILILIDVISDYLSNRKNSKEN